MFNEERMAEAIEDFIIKELKTTLTSKLDEVLEDVIVKAMKEVTIKLYRHKQSEGMNFEVTVGRKPNPES